MSIRPVDYQILMPKVNEIARNQNDEQHRLVGHAQQQAESATKQADQSTTIVHAQDEAHKASIREKQKERNKQQNQKEGQKKEDQETKNKQENKGSKLPQERRTIDIRL